MYGEVLTGPEVVPTQCEMCGKEVPNLRETIIEGTKMAVCGQCAQFGVETAGTDNEVTGRSRVTESLERRKRRQRTRDIYQGMEKELVPDYGEVIREAREGRGWSQEDLAKKLMEKKSVIAKLEHGDHHPSDPLVKKLEKTLDITLMERPEPVSTSSQSGSKSMTLGDLIKQQMDEG